MIADEKYKRLQKMYGFKIGIFMFIRFGRPMRKCGGVEKLHKNRMRHFLQFSALMHKDEQERKSKMIILEALKDLNSIKQLIIKGRKSYKQICYMKKKFQEKTITKNCKIEVLQLQWDKILKELKEQR